MVATNCAFFCEAISGAESNWFSEEMMKKYYDLQINIAVDE